MMKNLYQIFCLSLVVASCCAMEKRKEPEQLQQAVTTKKARVQSQQERSAFEQLPTDVKNIILSFLVTAPGRTKAAQLQAAAENIRTFMTLNRSFRSYLNDEKINGYLIEELARRYANDNIFEAAVALGTNAGGKWLRKSWDDLEIDEQRVFPQDILFHAVRTGDHFIVSFLLTHFPEMINNVTGSGDTPLILAAKSRRIAIAKRLLAVPGIDINIQNDSGESALMCAVDNDNYGSNDEELTELLLKAGANVNLRNEAQRTALMISSSWGISESVDALLKVPTIRVNLQDSAGNTALMLAASAAARSSCFPEIVQSLLNFQGINVNARNHEGKTALRLAKESSHDEEGAKEEIVALLLAHGGVE